MKNLNKKISAVALASMVVLGGVAASGAKSFADSRVKSSVSEQNLKEENINKLNEEIRKARYRGSSYSYKAFNCFNSKEEARNALKEYNKVNSSCIPKVNDRNLGRSLKRFCDLKSSYFGLEYEGKFYIIGLSYLV